MLETDQFTVELTAYGCLVRHKPTKAHILLCETWFNEFSLIDEENAFSREELIDELATDKMVDGDVLFYDEETNTLYCKNGMSELFKERSDALHNYRMETEAYRRNAL